MLEVTLRKQGAIAIIDLSGSIDIDSSVFIEKVGWCLTNGYKDLLCNFENVNFIDYSGLSVLSIAYKNVINHAARMKLVNMAPHIKKTLCLVCLDRVFDIYDDEESAIKSFEEEHVISEIQKKKLRRRFKRLPLDIDVQFKGKPEKEFKHGKVLNISAVGLLVFADKAYNLGEVLDVKLQLLPKPGWLEIDCKVVWLVQKDIQPQIYPGMGLEFYKMNNETQKKIVEFVDRNLPLGCSSD
ncbi:MAG: anti-sigma factor antagonist [Candidatus Omnitrophica bacterium]|nr:anti-sigma factor antagonist [Candidatus Omnitrophota bacterium]